MLSLPGGGIFSSARAEMTDNLVDKKDKTVSAVWKKFSFEEFDVERK